MECKFQYLQINYHWNIKKDQYASIKPEKVAFSFFFKRQC